MNKWFACYPYLEALGRRYFNGRVFAASEEEARAKYEALVPTGTKDVRFMPDPEWKGEVPAN